MQQNHLRKLLKTKMYKLLPQYSFKDGYLFLFDNKTNVKESEFMLKFRQNNFEELVKKKMIYSDSKLVKTKMSDKVILAPHSDDFCFSLCGNMLLHPSFRIINIFSKDDDFTLSSNLKSNDKIKYRKEEDLLISKLLDSEILFLDYPSEFLRGYINWNDSPNPTLDKPYITKLKKIILSLNEEIYCPLGVGNHVDHILVRDVVIQLMLDNKLNKKKVKFYEDLPYSGKYSVEYAINEIQNKIGDLEKQDLEITSVINKKIYLCSLYLTQINEKSLSLIKDYANSFHPKKYFERVWKLKFD